MKIVTPEEMARIDRVAIAQRGIPGAVLMERAGVALAAAVRQLLPPAGPDPLVVLLAGKGNNGGDALVAARRLTAAGVRTRTFLLARGRQLAGDAAGQRVRLLRSRRPLVELTDEKDLGGLEAALDEAAVVVDGIFGTGFKGAAGGVAGRAIELLNRVSTRTHPPQVVAADIPSGLDGVSGRTAGPAVRADWTVAMGLVKTGMVRGEGPGLCGRITTADLGFPPDLLSSAESDLELVDPRELSSLLLPRKILSHKGDYGRLLIIAGSPGMAGAAALAAAAALRAGTGLVTVGVPRGIHPVLEGLNLEAMTLPLPETAAGTLSPDALSPILDFCSSATAVALGPGISRDPQTGRLVESLVRQCPVPLLLDADGLHLVASHRSALAAARSPLVLTPHPGEMCRLAGIPPEELFRDRGAAARRFARSANLTLVLKGAGTLIASPSGPLWINLTGNPGLATGGSGDLLTGLIAGFLAQGLSAAAAARLGVYLHGAAGDRAARWRGMISLLPSDLLEELGAVLHRIFPWNQPPGAAREEKA